MGIADTGPVNVLYLAASSTLPDLSRQKAPYNRRHIRYSVDKILDNNPLTVWSENKEGPGSGESISLILDNTITIDAISFL
jgi:hypothetical protein